MMDDAVAEVKQAEATVLTCPECPRTFGQPHALGKHRRSAHGVIGQARRPVHGPKKTCPVCEKPVSARNSQWMAHMRTHPAGSRRWAVVELYWEWEYRLEHEGERGPKVMLTRTEATRGVKTQYSVHIDYGDGTVFTQALDPYTIKEAQAEAVEVFRRHPTAP